MPYLEIERKFLLRNDGWRAAVRSSTRMVQGYLNDERQCSVRVRIAGQAAWLNLKGVTLGAQRLEFEYPIPLANAERMLDSLTCKPLIEKIRHLVDFGEHTWEVDEFAGANAGLIVAEIELNDPDEAFALPDWAGAEVTDDPRYYNTCLAANPYQNWSAEQRR